MGIIIDLIFKFRLGTSKRRKAIDMEVEKQMFDKQISTKYFLNKYLLGHAKIMGHRVDS